MRNSYYLNKESKIDKLENIIKANCWFVYDQLKNNLPETLYIYFFHSTPYYTKTTHRLILPNIKDPS